MVGLFTTYYGDVYAERSKIAKNRHEWYFQIPLTLPFPNSPDFFYSVLVLLSPFLKVGYKWLKHICCTMTDFTKQTLFDAISVSNTLHTFLCLNV